MREGTDLGIGKGGISHNRIYRGFEKEEIILGAITTSKIVIKSKVLECRYYAARRKIVFIEITI